MENIRSYKVVAASGVLGTSPIMEQSVGAGKGYAASLGEPVLVIETVNGHTNRSVRCFPDGHTERLDTPTVKAEKRMVAEFDSEVGAFGLKAHMSGWGNHYLDGQLFIEMLTEPEPVKGNKATMEALEAAGYSLMVYVPYGWGRRRAFRVSTSRKVIVTAADEEVC